MEGHYFAVELANDSSVELLKYAECMTDRIK